MTSTPEKLDVEKANSVFAVLRDSPTIEDLLGFKQFAVSIAKNISNYSGLLETCQSGRLAVE